MEIKIIFVKLLYRTFYLFLRPSEKKKIHTFHNNNRNVLQQKALHIFGEHLFT